MSSELWLKIIHEWYKVGRTIRDKYGKVNPEYQELLSYKILE
ncbi:MAG: hypothetical protein QW328_04645 [Nitrososphaerota archaeon]